MSKAAKGVSLSGILKCLDKIAPLRRAEAWDNGMVEYALCIMRSQLKKNGFIDNVDETIHM